MKAQERLKSACRRLADAVGTPVFEARLTDFYAALAEASRQEKDTAQ